MEKTRNYKTKIKVLRRGGGGNHTQIILWFSSPYGPPTVVFRRREWRPEAADAGSAASLEAHRHDLVSIEVFLANNWFYSSWCWHLFSFFHFYVQSPDVFQRPDAANATAFHRLGSRRAGASRPARPPNRLLASSVSSRRGGSAGASPAIGDGLWRK